MKIDGNEFLEQLINKNKDERQKKQRELKKTLGIIVKLRSYFGGTLRMLQRSQKRKLRNCRMASCIRTTPSMSDMFIKNAKLDQVV